MSRLRIRPAGPADRAGVAGLLRGLSAESAYRRFQTALPPEPGSVILDALLPEDLQGGAVLAHDGGSLVGHGVWRRAGTTPVAEIGLIVADTHQGRGIGTALARALLADLAGAERAVAMALALLLARQRGQGSGYREVALAGIAEDFAAPLRHGLTAPGGLLGGGLQTYNIYPAQDGWVALAALEPVFVQRLQEALNITKLSHSALADIFRTQPAHIWEQWAITHDLPLVAVHDPITNADHSSY